MKIDRQHLSLAAEYAVASELCKRNIYAQLTLGNLKRTDILCSSESGLLRIQVKGKQAREWPRVKNIFGDDMILVLVDFEKKLDSERPDFYILTAQDWKKFLKKNYSQYVKSGEAVIDDKNTITWIREKKPYKGTGVKPGEIMKFKEKWEKFIEKLDL